MTLKIGLEPSLWNFTTNRFEKNQLHYNAYLQQQHFGRVKGPSFLFFLYTFSKMTLFYAWWMPRLISSGSDIWALSLRRSAEICNLIAQQWLYYYWDLCFIADVTNLLGMLICNFFVKNFLSKVLSCIYCWPAFERPHIKELGIEKHWVGLRFECGFDINCADWGGTDLVKMLGKRKMKKKQGETEILYLEHFYFRDQIHYYYR